MENLRRRQDRRANSFPIFTRRYFLADLHRSVLTVAGIEDADHAEDGAKSAPACRAGRRGGSTMVDDDAPRGHETILVVEDDELVRDLVIEVMADLGYRVFHALDGNGALDVIGRGEPIDLLFTDVSLPNHMSGVELARAARERRPDLKILLTTGDEKLAAVAKEFPSVAKPYRRTELAIRLRDALKP
jgi:CheY-like chemotaxis protein